jgi:hypothetical protein
MPKPFLLLLLILPATLQGQTDSTQKGWAATLTAALIPIGSTAVGIQPGVEYKFNDRLNLLSEITFSVGRKNKGLLQDRHYMRFKSELRYNYFNKRKKNFHEYTGLMLTWASRRFIDSNGYYYETRHSDSAVFFDKAKLKSPITTISVQSGCIIADGRLGVDVFMGFGIKLVNTTITEIANPRKGIVETRGFHFPAAYNYAGNTSWFHFNAGIRLIWHFYDFQHPGKR